MRAGNIVEIRRGRFRPRPGILQLDATESLQRHNWGKPRGSVFCVNHDRSLRTEVLTRLTRVFAGSGAGGDGRLHAGEAALCQALAAPR